MRFEALLDSFGQQGWFDYPSVLLLFPEGEAAVRTSLYRFKKAGSLVELRRGMYAFSERHRRIGIVAPALAGEIYPPSCLSERWALSWYGAIPEKTALYTSVSPRPRASFENPFGVFSYRSLKQTLFWGYRAETILGAAVRMASPEKALLDLMYLEGGEWSEPRFESFRVEPRVLDATTLVSFARRSGSPRLQRASQAFIRYAEASREGEVHL